MDTPDRILWTASLLLTLVAAPVIGHVVLGPVNRAAGRLRAPTRFLLMDFLWLVVQLQLALGFSVQYIGVQYVGPFIMMLGFLTLAAVLMWAGAVSFLSRAGVRSALRRGVFILVLLPATLALMVTSPMLPVACYLMETEPQMIEIVLRLNRNLPPNMGLWVGGAGILFLPLVGYGLYRISAWMVRGVEFVPEMKAPIAA